MRYRLLCVVAGVAMGSLAAQDSVVLNESIKPVYFEPLVYPLVARLQRVQGAVVLRVTLGEGGKVVAATAISGAKALLVDCVSNAKKWRFQQNAERSAVIVYHFKIEGLCSLPCPSQFRFEPPNLAVITIGEPVVDHAGR